MRKVNENINYVIISSISKGGIPDKEEAAQKTRYMFGYEKFDDYAIAFQNIVKNGNVKNYFKKTLTYSSDFFRGQVIKAMNDWLGYCIAQSETKFGEVQPDLITFTPKDFLDNPKLLSDWQNNKI